MIITLQLFYAAITTAAAAAVLLLNNPDCPNEMKLLSVQFDSKRVYAATYDHHVTIKYQVDFKTMKFPYFFTDYKITCDDGLNTISNSANNEIVSVSQDGRVVYETEIYVSGKMGADDYKISFNSSIIDSYYRTSSPCYDKKYEFYFDANPGIVINYNYNVKVALPIDTSIAVIDKVFGHNAPAMLRHFGVAVQTRCDDSLLELVYRVGGRGGGDSKVEKRIKKDIKVRGKSIFDFKLSSVEIDNHGEYVEFFFLLNDCGVEIIDNNYGRNYRGLI